MQGYELQSDREVVLAAVAQNGRALEHASAELQGDREVVLAAVAQDGHALKHASAELQGDREVVLAALAHDGDMSAALSSENPNTHAEYVAQAKRERQKHDNGRRSGSGTSTEVANQEVANRLAIFERRAGLKKQWMGVLGLPVVLRADREVMLTAVARNGGALRYASAELQGDREVVLAALAEDGRALGYASAALRRDTQVVAVARTTVLAWLDSDDYAGNQGWRHVLSGAPAELKADRPVLLAAVVQDGMALQHASAELQGEREEVLAAVAHDIHETSSNAEYGLWGHTGRALRHASAELQADKDALLAEVPPPRPCLFILRPRPPLPCSSIPGEAGRGGGRLVRMAGGAASGGAAGILSSVGCTLSNWPGRWAAFRKRRKFTLSTR
jgi:hypothetical protein